MKDKFISKDCNNIPFIYTNEGVQTEPKFVIPNNIYKFYALNERNIEALSKNHLFASHPYLLNDSADSSDRIFNFKDLKKEFFIGFYKTHLKENYSDSEIFELYKKDKVNNFKEIRETFVSSLSNKFGTISLTQNCKNAPMWSHYTEEKGFCIEFNTIDLLDDYKNLNHDVKDVFFRPMQYVEEIELLNFTGDEFLGFTVPFLYLTTVKNKEWMYEKEYRLNISKQNMDVPFSKKYSTLKDHEGTNDRYFRYKNSAITRIFLGQNFFNNEGINMINENTFEITISEKTRDLENFINLLFESYNDKIFLVGETQENGYLEKANERIYFERLYLNRFKFIRTKKMYML